MERKDRPYEALRRLMSALGVPGYEIALAWNKHSGERMTEARLSKMLNNRLRMHTDFCYFVLDYLGIPHEQFSEYFPNGGFKA